MAELCAESLLYGLQVCGVSPLARDWLETYDLDSGWEDEMVSMATGKDFALLRTAQGKVRRVPRSRLSSMTFYKSCFV